MHVGNWLSAKVRSSFSGEREVFTNDPGIIGPPFEKKYLYQAGRGGLQGPWGHRKFSVGVGGHVPVLIVVMIFTSYTCKKLSRYTLLICI